MCKWVFLAGKERLKHVALMRSSAASKRFCAINVLAVTLGLGLVQATHAGWHRGGDSFEAAKPTGRGWLAVVKSPGTSVSAIEERVELWWNPAQAIVGGAVGLIAALAVIRLALMLVRIGAELSHLERYRGEQRMTAALHYSTAWLAPVLLAVLVVAARPLATFARAAGSGWYPAPASMNLLAGVTGGFAALMWWFWLIRLGTTAPADMRGRAIGFYAIGSPALAIAACVGWWVGMDRLSRPLFDWLNMAF